MRLIDADAFMREIEDRMQYIRGMGYVHQLRGAVEYNVLEAIKNALDKSAKEAISVGETEEEWKQCVERAKQS